MLESTRIDVYALRSASRRAGAAANKPGRNSRSPDFVLELSSEVWFRVFVTFRDSNPGVPVTNVSQGTDIEDPATGVSVSIGVSFIAAAKPCAPGQQPFDKSIEVYRGTRVPCPFSVPLGST